MWMCVSMVQCDSILPHTQWIHHNKKIRMNKVQLHEPLNTVDFFLSLFGRILKESLCTRFCSLRGKRWSFQVEYSAVQKTFRDSFREQNIEHALRNNNTEVHHCLVTWMVSCMTCLFYRSKYMLYLRLVWIVVVRPTFLNDLGNTNANLNG